MEKQTAYYGHAVIQIKQFRFAFVFFPLLRSHANAFCETNHTKNENLFRLSLPPQSHSAWPLLFFPSFSVSNHRFIPYLLCLSFSSPLFSHSFYRAPLLCTSSLPQLYSLVDVCFRPKTLRCYSPMLSIFIRCSALPYLFELFHRNYAVVRKCEHKIKPGRPAGKLCSYLSLNLPVRTTAPTTNIHLFYQNKQKLQCVRMHCVRHTGHSQQLFATSVKS